MDLYSGYINHLIEELAALPGIGSKSAQRLAFHIINMPKGRVEKLARSMTDAKEHVRYCEECFTLTDAEKCPICSNEKRDHTTIMVVENTRDLAAYEKTGRFEGVYHVLHGAISPMLGIGPDDIRLKELMKRPFICAPASCNRQRAAAVAVLAQRYAQEGRMENARDHAPEYLRPSQAERTRREKAATAGGQKQNVQEQNGQEPGSHVDH